MEAVVIALRFDDVVLSAVRELAPMYPHRTLADLVASVTDSLETAAADGALRLVGPWVVIR